MFADEHNKAFWLNSHKLGATLIDRWGYKESLLVYRDCISQSDKELNITHTKPTIYSQTEIVMMILRTCRYFSRISKNDSAYKELAHD